MKKLLALIALIVGLVGLAPVTSSHAASNCTQARLGEFGASNITSGSATYTPGAATGTATDEGPNHLVVGGVVAVDDEEERTTYGSGTLDVVVDLQGKSCAAIDYGIKVYEQTWSGEAGNLLYSDTVRSAGAFSVKLAQAAPITTDWDCVHVVATTSSDGTVLDSAPDTGTNTVCKGSGGGQTWN